VPTKPNRTKIATPNDVVMTPEKSAIQIINHFQPKGSILEPCRGEGAFYKNFTNTDKDWCEISEGKDFLKYDKKVDWIITNPPFSIFDVFLLHALKISDNVVFFCPLNKVFKSIKLDMKISEYGGIKEVVHMGSGGMHKFPFGFVVGCIYYKRNYKGPIEYNRMYAKDKYGVSTLEEFE
tara:strand:+ start:196 stop:732 length:537 start_codon:yes stop_codon:yes gene_type:complete